jgi:DNA invertase Pin-like site-specific DNA recombinase
MPPRLTPSKIRPDHLARDAWTYVRQSSLAQVRTHTASAARQYDLVQRALELGWPREHVRVVDQDQGHSGASAAGRDGFQALVAEVGLGHAGAVLSLEASRLARSCSDWYRLLELCALTDTLVIDEDGVYDPGQYDDRLLLGFKRPAAYYTSCSTSRLQPFGPVSAVVGNEACRLPRPQPWRRQR